MILNTFMSKLVNKNMQLNLNFRGSEGQHDPAIMLEIILNILQAGSQFALSVILNKVTLNVG